MHSLVYRQLTTAINHEAAVSVGREHHEISAEQLHHFVFDPSLLVQSQHDDSESFALAFACQHHLEFILRHNRQGVPPTSLDNIAVVPSVVPSVVPPVFIHVSRTRETRDFPPSVYPALTLSTPGLG